MDIAYLTSMKIPSRTEALEYLKNQALAQFVGFYVGISSTGLVSHFFETRSISNLWGVLARKPLVNAQTFNVLERIVAVVIGFIVFEIVSRNLKPLIDRWKPVIVLEVSRRWKDQGWDTKAKLILPAIKKNGGAVYSSANAAVREAIRSRFQK